MFNLPDTDRRTESNRKLKVIQAKRNLRKLEMEAYASAVDVFRAQGVLTEEKLETLQNLCHHYQIPAERHFAELRRALSDDDLNEIAETLVGYDPTPSWLEEAGKYVDLFNPFIPKSHFTTNAFRAVSNFYTNSLMRSQLPPEENGDKLPEQFESRLEEPVRVTEHEYHCKIDPVAAKLLAECQDEEEYASLSRAYLTPVGMDGLLEVLGIPDPDPCDDEKAPFMPSLDFFIEEFGKENRRGTEPTSLPSKRRRNASEHKSVDETPSYESKRSDKHTPSSSSKVMQDYQLLMNHMKKKGKLDQPSTPSPTSDRRRGKGKRGESVTPQETSNPGGEGKNLSGLIVPCLSLERIPLSQPKSDTSPTKQQKTEAPVMKGGRMKWKKKKLSKTAHVKTIKIDRKGVTQQKSPVPVKKRRQIRVRSTTSNQSEPDTSPQQVETPVPNSTSTPPHTDICPATDSLTETAAVQPNTNESDTMITQQSLITFQSDDVIDKPVVVESEVDMPENRPADPTQVSPLKDSELPLPADILPLTSHDTEIEHTADIPILSPHINTESPIQSDTNPTFSPEATTPPSEVPGVAPLSPDTLDTADYPVSERKLVRAKKDSTNSLDIPSPDRIKCGLQGLYSPISSLDTPPDHDRSAHLVLISESTPLSDQLIPRPLFSPITSPEESFSQSPVKSVSSSLLHTSDQLSMVLQEPHVDILPTNKCSLALSDIVDEVCDSISDPISHHSTTEEVKPFTPSTDSVFTDSSFMLSKALDSFITGFISNREAPGEATPHPQQTDLLSSQVLTTGQNLDFAQLSASLLNMEQQGEGTSEVTAPSPTDDDPSS